MEKNKLLAFKGQEIALMRREMNKQQENLDKTQSQFHKKEESLQDEKNKQNEYIQLLTEKNQILSNQNSEIQKELDLTNKSLVHSKLEAINREEKLKVLEMKVSMQNKDISGIFEESQRIQKEKIELETQVSLLREENLNLKLKL